MVLVALCDPVNPPARPTFTIVAITAGNFFQSDAGFWGAMDRYRTSDNGS